jgi:hypothetical protein
LFDDFGLDVEVGVDVLRDASSSVVVAADAVTAAADLVDWQNLSEEHSRQQLPRKISETISSEISFSGFAGPVVNCFGRYLCLLA